MKNYIQPGHMMTVPAPTGGVSSGDGVLTGALFGVAATDAAETVSVEIAMTGVFTLPKKAADVAALGAKLYWDNTNKHVTVTAAGNTLIGAAFKAAAGPDATVAVRLNGTA
jgi:predicted RecA/RadA family phage recombinase